MAYKTLKGGLRAARAAWGTQANGGSEARGKTYSHNKIPSGSSTAVSLAQLNIGTI